MTTLMSWRELKNEFTQKRLFSSRHLGQIDRSIQCVDAEKEEIDYLSISPLGLEEIINRIILEHVSVLSRGGPLR